MIILVPQGGISLFQRTGSGSRGLMHIHKSLPNDWTYAVESCPEVVKRVQIIAVVDDQR